MTAAVYVSRLTLLMSSSLNNEVHVYSGVQITACTYSCIEYIDVGMHWQIRSTIKVLTLYGLKYMHLSLCCRLQVWGV